MLPIQDIYSTFRNIFTECVPFNLFLNFSLLGLKKVLKGLTLTFIKPAETVLHVSVVTKKIKGYLV